MLVVIEQSRLTRGDDAKALIKDVLFHGGRFVSITEGIETDKKGWSLSVGFSELHHSRQRGHGRGMKPPKRVVIDEAAATVVRTIFERFTANHSINSIVRWWEEHKAMFLTITKTRIYHQHVRRGTSSPSGRRQYINRTYRPWPEDLMTTRFGSFGNSAKSGARPIRATGRRSLVVSGQP